MLENVSSVVNSGRYRSAAYRLNSSSGNRGRNRFGFYDSNFKALAWMITNEYPEGFISTTGVSALLKVLLILWWKSQPKESQDALIGKLKAYLDSVIAEQANHG